VTFCCIIIFYVSAAEPAIGKSIFVWNWHPRETRLISTQLSVRSSVRSFVTGRSDPLTVSAMPILQPPRNEPQRPILLRICFFFNFFLDLFFRKNLRLRICFFFYLFFFGWRLASSSGEHSQQPCRRRGYFRSKVSNGRGGGHGCIMHRVHTSIIVFNLVRH
jgi:hypothetical protein